MRYTFWNICKRESEAEGNDEAKMFEKMHGMNHIILNEKCERAAFERSYGGQLRLQQLMSSHYEKNTKYRSTHRRASMFNVIQGGFCSFVGWLSTKPKSSGRPVDENSAKIKRALPCETNYLYLGGDYPYSPLQP